MIAKAVMEPENVPNAREAEDKDFCRAVQNAAERATVLFVKVKVRHRNLGLVVSNEVFHRVKNQTKFALTINSFGDTFQKTKRNSI